MYLTIRNVWGTSHYRLSNYSKGNRWWWMNLDGSSAGVGPFDSREEAVEYGRRNGSVC